MFLYIRPHGLADEFPNNNERYIRFLRDIPLYICSLFNCPSSFSRSSQVVVSQPRPLQSKTDSYFALQVIFFDIYIGYVPKK